MSHYFISTILILSFSAFTLAEGEAEREKPKTSEAKEKTFNKAPVNMWFEYEHSLSAPTNLTIMGFTEDTICAIALMRSFNSAGSTDVRKISRNLSARNSAFEQTVQRGITVLKSFESLQALPETELKEIVYKHMMMNEQLLSTAVNAAQAQTQDEAGSDDVKSSISLTRAQMYERLYKNYQCAERINYSIDKENGASE